MKWIYTALIVTVLSVAHVIAQDVFVTLPVVPTKNPLEGNADAITAGMGVYRVRCADCHGMDARGIRAPDITQVWARGRTDGAPFSAPFGTGYRAPKCLPTRPRACPTRTSGGSSPT